ncbi:hypothetical protein TNCV_227021 [Trichonephila clavipes]|nr:hypothetical protein TNCV_227021 [Trichonephila clavipes]
MTTIIKDVSGEAQSSIPILLSLLHAHTGPQPGVIVWRTISFDSRTPLVVITAQSLSNTSLASQITRSLSNRACVGYDGKATASNRECS